MKTDVLFVTAATTIALLSFEATASKEFVALIPNGGNVANAPAIGHSDNTGKSSAANAFGEAFADARKSWASGLCQADTDGDGQTNGKELGDPCCEWLVGSTPRWQTGVSHPSDASKTSNESLWSSIDCSNVTKIAATSAASTTVGTTSLAAVSALIVVAMARVLPVGPPESTSNPCLNKFETTSTFTFQNSIAKQPSLTSPQKAIHPSPVKKITTVGTTKVATAFALAALLASEIDASKKFVKMIPNGGNVPNTPAIGHPDGTGDDPSTNAFGDAFSEAGNKWTKELCEADTDGDGQTNGQELGDPCCEWDMDMNPVVQWTDGVSHPDDATKTSDESLWANIVCGSAPASGTSETTATVEDSSSSTDNSTASSSASSKMSSSTPTSTTADPSSSSQSSSTPSTSTNSAPVPTQSIFTAIAGVVIVVVMNFA